MSLLAFQTALADLGASPALCARVAADPDAALAAYDLSPRERRRLAAAAGQPGVRVNWVLYRYNRIMALAAVLPGTLHLLGPDMRALSDAFWAAHGHDRNLHREAERFVEMLGEALDAGRLSSPFLREVMAFELLRHEVAGLPHRAMAARVAEEAARWPDGPLAPHPLVRVAAFAHDPAVLLPRLAAKQPLPYDDLAEGEFFLLLDCREGSYRERAVEPGWGRVLLGRERGDAEAVAVMEREGVLVRTASPA